MTPAASAVLVEKYRSLRQDEGGPGKSSFRITVRQLESMIRLSEAIARANCQHEITPAIVREAYSLLRQSIIHVEQDDISFDDEDEGNGLNGPDGPGGDDGMDEDPQLSSADLAALDEAELSYQRTSSAQQQEQQARETSVATTQPSKRKMRITCEHPFFLPCLNELITYADNQYMEIMNLCVLYLSEVERDSGTGVDREELIQWYLEQKENDFESEEDMEYEREVIGKALTKLAKVRLMV